MWLLSVKLKICEQMMCSRSLQVTHVSETGLYLHRLCTFHFFNTRLTIALVQSEGMIPLSSFWLKRASRAGAKTLANSLCTRFGILSGSDALCGLSDESSC